jgi:heme/copper-type cytochrome/quinol oxidase subunit 4
MSANDDGNGAGKGPVRLHGLGPGATGFMVFVILAVLAALEYGIFLWVERNLIWMIIMNVIDAALILVYFMHLPRLWRGENEEGE